MKRVIWWGELLAGLGLLTVGFLQDCSLTFGRPLISYVLWPTIFLAGLLCLYRVIHLKYYWKSRGFWLMVAFCGCYLISTVLNIRFGWYENIRTLILQGFLFFLIYCYPDEPEVNGSRKRDIWMGYFIIACSILSILSFVYFLTGRNEIYYPEVASIPLYYTGFYWGRLYGVYWDPNIGGLMCCVSLMLSAEFFRRYKSVVVRILMCASIALSVLYIAFSDSRTGRLAMGIGVAIYAVVWASKSRKRAVASTCAALAVVVAIGAPVLIKSTYNNMMQAQEEALQAAEEEALLEAEQEQLKEAAKESAKTEDKKEPKTETSRKPVKIDEAEIAQKMAEGEITGTETVIRQSDDISADLTNRRLDIWKSAVDIFLANPVFGVGHNTVLAYVEAEQPDSYLINNDHMHFASMHNTFFDVLVAQGAAGFALYLAMAILFVVVILKDRSRIFEQMEGQGIVMFALVAAMVCASCFMSEIVYVCSPMSFMFWMALSVMMRASKPKKEA